MTSRFPVMTAALCTLFSLWGCVGVVPDPQTPPAGSSPVFQSAYRDGCTTGYHDVQRAGYDGNEFDRLNRSQYQADTDYRAGYDLGYKTCREDDLRTPHRYIGAP